MKKNSFIIAAALLVVFFLNTAAAAPVKAADENMYETFSFEGNEADYDEFIHLLSAKLVYDSLTDYEGQSVAEYVAARPALYQNEIWEGSGITYDSLYRYFIGDYTIRKVFDENDKSGMYAVLFEKDKELILSFRGSDSFFDTLAWDESNDWINTDFRFALQNELSGQFRDVDGCLDYVEKNFHIKDGSYDYTFAGHSLGGALVVYASMRSGYYGYSFDGAAGHVIDLIYSDRYLDLSEFKGVDKQNFCNYTDETGYPIADMIQHTNAHAMYQVDRETFLDHLNENTFVPRAAQAESHIIWSTVRYDGNVISLTDRVRADEDGYTFAPKDAVTLSIAKPVSKFTDVILSLIKGGFNRDFFSMLKISVGAAKDKKLILCSSEGGKQRALDFATIFGGYTAGTVLYGGDGDDELTGYDYDDVLIAGRGDDVLVGGKGMDKYIISKNPGHTTKITDEDGVTRIMFKNMDVRSLKDIGIDSATSKGTVITFRDGQKIILDVKGEIKFYAYDGNEIKQLEVNE